MTYTFSLENIDHAVEDAILFLRAGKIDRKEVTKIRLSLEEVLLAYREEFGETESFTIRFGKAFSNRKIRIYVPGPMFNPFQIEEEEESIVLRTALNQMNARPLWRYQGKRNSLTFSLEKKKLPSWAGLVIAIVSALIIGLLAKMAATSAQVLIRDDILTPLLDTFLGFLTAVASPMIFLSVLWSIYSMGDVNTFSKYGKKLTICSAASSFLIPVIVLVCLLPVLHLNFGTGSADSGGFSELYTMLLDIVPDNLFTPFTAGNTLQILFLGIIVGLCMIFLGDRCQGVGILVQQLGDIVKMLMGWLTKLLSVFIFGSIVKTMLGDGIDFSGTSGLFLSLTLAACLLSVVLHTIVVSVSLHISPLAIWKHNLKVVVIGFTTASSMATFSEKIEACTEKFGVDEKFCQFGVSLSQVLYKPGPVFPFLIAPLCVAGTMDMPVTVSWIMIALIVAVFLAVATPPVAGSSTACYAIIFAQFALPTTELPLILSLDILLEFVYTAAMVFGQQCLLLFTAKRLGKLHRKESF